MTATFKELTDFFRSVGADEVAHSDKTYLAHAIGVYNDLKEWGCHEDVARVGIFHSVYGTELFQGFTLPLDRRDEVRALVGERTEWLSYLNCAMDRTHFDAQIKESGPNTILDRFTGTELDVSDQDFDDLCTVHMCDWLEQVERSDNWDYRRTAYRTLAERLGGIALVSYDQVFANAPA
ncbi:MAG: hypothetical protein H8E66_03645 [Planctomycetes bacterium]|nr:hypothetical protein [Planctomycetota bacterium]